MIPEKEIRDGGPAKDGIPAIISPDLNGAGEINYLDDSDLVLGFVDGDDIRAYPHAILNWHKIINDKTAPGNKVIQDIFQNEKLFVVSNYNANFIVAFKRTLDGDIELNFEAVQDNFPVVLLDNEGTRWDVSGRGVSGPRTGEQLDTVIQMMGYWFAFPAFYPDIELK